VEVSTNPAGLNVIVTYDEESQAPVNAGVYNVVATVNEANYQGFATGQLVVSKANSVVSVWPVASSITYGQTLEASNLTGGQTIPEGVFTFENALLVLNAGVHNVAVTFTPNDSQNHNSLQGTVNVTVNKATAEVVLSGLSQVYSGQPISVSAVTNPENLTLEITYNNETVLPVNAGSYVVSAMVVDNNHEGSATDVLVIEKATAQVVISNLNHLFDGTPKMVTVATTPEGLTIDVTYNGSTNPPSEIGEYTVIATVNELNYAGSAEANMIISDKIIPVVVWPTATSIVYQQTLAMSILTGGSATNEGENVNGTFAFQDNSITPNAGQYVATVIFTPQNTEMFSTVTGQVVVEVQKATPIIISWPTTSQIELGQALAASTLSGGQASTDGTFAFVNPEEIPAVAGIFAAAAIFTPADSDNFNTVEGQIDVLVIDTTPTEFTVTFVVDGRKELLEGVIIAINGEEIVTDANSVATIILENGSYDYVATMENYETVHGTVVVDGDDITVPLIMHHVGISGVSVSDLKMYPNPFESQITIDSRDNLDELIISTISGKNLYRVTLNGVRENSIEIDLPSGVYLFTFIKMDGTRVVQKMIRK
jgi:hypothetical protein